MSSHPVVEVLFIRVDAGALTYRQQQTELRPGTHPDQAALGLGPSGDPLLHSTSWRYDPAGHIVLTYAMCPDPRPDLPGRPVPHTSTAHAETPTSPSPARIHLDDVAAHAVRHLAWLAETDPVARDFLTAHPDLSAALSPLNPAPAVRL
ncbi:hypothetical protein [Rhizohabitans arisaemae]|uniref:hypothetical protein n=1 Tax=Rhizohabitans arisaemae TaxID=2720610 RepID=UPI0024B225F5|nr:hypothetical protein [Rhizohabitans arisaemae]